MSATRTAEGRFAPAPPAQPRQTELFAIWSVAEAEANLAFDAWRDTPSAETYAVFVAADDRASAAQDALAHNAAS